MVSTYSEPFYPFPWPKDLACGQPYIHWRDDDIKSSDTLYTEVAIPETWVDVNIEGREETGNRTNRGFSLVLTRKPAIGRTNSTGARVIRFVSMYRGKFFETSEDKLYKPDTYYLEYLGLPKTDTPCDIPYHLLSYPYNAGVLDNWHLARAENNDWLFQLYTADLLTDKPYEMPYFVPPESPQARELLAESRVLSLCDRYGKHAKYIDGKLRCTFPKDAEQPHNTVTSPLPRPESGGGSNGTNLGLALGISTGVLGAVLLACAVYFSLPWLRRKFRRGGDIRL